MPQTGASCDAPDLVSVAGTGLPGSATTAERRSRRRDGQRLVVGLREAKLRHGMTESDNGCLRGRPAF
ncbi:hypothetical protein K788_0002476 [Paraburkholderia caribensis MBA4]|uniref:Uncharacterized protein n=1 Tax=Paraburkholderia caribensis MBA4 TaxID=1323664 RepID=A0A0P0R9I8_9BURK|nr:hypothetical protein K788_0002476 [Paraburkholderia caribensis MBA4]